MFLSNIDLTNFKNHSSLKIDFNEKINCFTGDNGVGKTNLLDAIYYLCTCKSYFSGIDALNINHAEDFFMIKGDFNKDGIENSIQCSVERSKKKIFKNNNKIYKKLLDHIGKFPIVVVAPNDISLILEGSTERRKFTDACISQYDKKYLQCLVKYNKIILQRNTLLKNFAKHNVFEQTSIDIWDDQLIEPCKYIHKKRKEFIDFINPIFEENYQSISDSKHEVPKIIYKSQLHEKDIETLLKENLAKDRIVQNTSVGIHKDDLELNLNDYPIKKHGSQGQNKTFLISLKFAQFEVLKRSLNVKPILLLDDIFDKLDKKRVANIVKLVSEEHFQQIFITDTNKERLVTILKETTISNKIIEIN
jgi:DNA replication and repair protein RecF